MYVPGIVDRILSAPGGLNLKGYAVGDGCMASPPVNQEKCRGPVYDIEFFGGHGQFSNELRDSIRADCDKAMLCSGNLSTTCTAHVAEMRKEIGAYYVYNLYVGRSIPPPWGVNPISSGSPHARPMGVHCTCGEPDEIKKNTHRENVTALFREQLRGLPLGWWWWASARLQEPPGRAREDHGHRRTQRLRLPWQRAAHLFGQRQGGKRR